MKQTDKLKKHPNSTKKQPNRTRTLVFAALCCALGVALPMTVHGIPGAGLVFLPMHLPVLLCGLLCGPVWGLACGAVTPVVSCLATGMPPAAKLPVMLCELAAYGAVSGLAVRWVRVHSRAGRLYLSLAAAMLAGRVVSGLAGGLVFGAGTTLRSWVTVSFVTALPGIVIQLILLPALVLALQKAGLADG